MALVIFYPVLKDIPDYVGELVEPGHRRSDPVTLKAGTLTAAIAPEDVEEYQRREWIGEPIEWLRTRPPMPADIAAEIRKEIRAAERADPTIRGKFDDMMKARMRPGADPTRGDPRSKPVDVAAELQKVRANNVERKRRRDDEKRERDAETKWRDELRAKRAAAKP